MRTSRTYSLRFSDLSRSPASRCRRAGSRGSRSHARAPRVPRHPPHPRQPEFFDSQVHVAKGSLDNLTPHARERPIAASCATMCTQACAAPLCAKTRSRNLRSRATSSFSPWPRSRSIELPQSMIALRLSRSGAKARSVPSTAMNSLASGVHFVERLDQANGLLAASLAHEAHERKEAVADREAHRPAVLRERAGYPRFLCLKIQQGQDRPDRSPNDAPHLAADPPKDFRREDGLPSLAQPRCFRAWPALQNHGSLGRARSRLASWSKNLTTLPAAMITAAPQPLRGLLEPLRIARRLRLLSNRAGRMVRDRW